MENINFTAIDFETANSKRSSICEIGIAVVTNSVVTEQRSWLVQPDENKYDSFNVHLHGIHLEITQNAPTFSEVWEEVKPYLEGKTVVSHNTSFDMYALRDALTLNQIPFPSFRFFCSLRLARYVFKGMSSYSLPSLCNTLEIPFDETHRAEADAKGCAELFMKCLEKAEVQSIEELEEKFNFNCGQFFGEQFVPQFSKDSHKPSILSKITAHPEKEDVGNYFYGKKVCFTGTFLYANRVELLQTISDIGGIPSNSVTKDTNVLVVGTQDPSRVVHSGKSGKEKKAFDMLDDGGDIEILTETEFLEFL